MGDRGRRWGSAKSPTVLELAYLVNLEYLLEPRKTIYDIPKDKNAIVPLEEMITFFEDGNWQIRDRVYYGEYGKLIYPCVFISDKKVPLFLNL